MRRVAGRMPWLTIVLTIMFCGIPPQTAGAQSGGWYFDWQCPPGSGSGPAGCAALMGGDKGTAGPVTAAECETGRRNWIAKHFTVSECRGGGSSTSSSPAASERLPLARSPGEGIYRGVVGGGLLGALVGSLVTGPDTSKNYWESGAIAGAAAGGMLAMSLWTSRMPTPAAVGLSALGGFAVGYEYGVFKKYEGDTPAQAQKAHALYIQNGEIGAAVAVVGFTMKKVLGAKRMRTGPAILRGLADLSFDPTKRSLSTSIKW